MLADLTISDFIGHVNDSFRVALGTEEMLELQLIEATKIGESRRPATARDQGAAVFLDLQGPAATGCSPNESIRSSTPLWARWRSSSCRWGPTADSTGLHYQAVFN